jgi:hypothetical protein
MKDAGIEARYEQIGVLAGGAAHGIADLRRLVARGRAAVGVTGAFCPEAPNVW